MPQHSTQSARANVVGPLIRRHRVKAGLTQKELVALCGKRGQHITRGMLAKIEAQVRFVKACELFVIARSLNVSLERFFPSEFGRG